MKQVVLFVVSWATLNLMAQDLSFSDVRKLSPQVNSSCEEILPLLSPDKKTLYFVRSSCPENTGGKFAGSDIWVSNFNRSTNWSRPTNTNLFNDKYHNAMVGISIDGGTVFQLNTRPNKETPGIFFTKRLNNSRTLPKLIPLSFLNTKGFIGLYISPDSSVILISMENVEGQGQEDLYVSLKSESGEWSMPHNLGPTINSEGFEISPFLSPDKKRLYFTSSGHWGLGNGDIFYSDRLDETWEKWGPPVNLGNQVNSKSFDAYFSIYDSVAYFSSNRESQFSDLYMVSVKNEEDSVQQKIKKIVAEARSILVDLGDDTTDSLTATSGTV